MRKTSENKIRGELLLRDRSAYHKDTYVDCIKTRTKRLHNINIFISFEIINDVSCLCSENRCFFPVISARLESSLSLLCFADLL